jgi:dienelactone hydrolase
MKVAFVLVAALLLGACQTDKLVTKQADDPRPTSVNYIARPKGPQVAKGAVIFINGLDFRNLRHHYDDPTPDILRWFVTAGFDVYRLDLAPKDQNPSDVLFAATERAILHMRRQNYRRVFIVGQSAGGNAGLASISQGSPVQSDGAIAFAVGGINGLASAEFNLGYHRLFTGQIEPTKRVAVFHFRNDKVLGQWQREAVEISRANLSGRRNAMVRVPPTVEGHGAAGTFEFESAYGRCLAEFLAADDPDGSVCPP